MRVSYDLLIHGGTVALPSGLTRADVAITDGRIEAIGDLSTAAAAEKVNARNLHVLPGIIDSQCHFREPGLTHKEDLGSGSASAALGGVTTFFEMPNTQPSTTTAEALAWKVRRAKETSWADFAFYAGACTENADSLGELESLEGCCGVKVFLGSSTGSLLVDDPAVLARVLRSSRKRVACHSELEARLQERKPLAQKVHDHPVWRDEECAVASTRALLEQARAAGRKVHVLHVTTAGELPLLAAARDLATCEVTPQHLTLEAPDCYDRLGTLAQMNPPIRDGRHRAALWEAIRSGLIDVLGSDHAPHTREEKAKPYPQSPSGMPGVQTLLPLMLDHVHHGRLSLERLVDLTAHGPARIFGLGQKGRLEVGRDADVTLVDLKREHVITSAEQRTKVGWTPFDGLKVTGFPIGTLLRGKFVMREGVLQGKPGGRPVQVGALG
ncbi:MAG: dihydroorotase [Archangiaceae bacterium]|nr:dihydroorotase [Archangiaceae bacterium]